MKNVELNALIPGSTHFKWKEALWLPRWDVHVFPNEEQYQNIIRTAQKMDVIRNRTGKPVKITSWLRPTNYNRWPDPYGVSGSKNSAHMHGLAVDFQVLTMTADQVRQQILPELERLNIRMENLPGSNWVHIDLLAPGGSGRFFIP